MNAQFCHRLMIPLLVSLPLVLACPEARAGDPFWAINTPQGQFEPTAGVGPEGVVQTGNYRVAYYDRQGTQRWKARLARDHDTSFSSNYFWRDDNFDGGVDPRVIYDQFSQRFIVIDMGDTIPFLYLAISKDSTPDDWDAVHWDRFIIPIDAAAGLTPFDWPALSVNDGWIYVACKKGTQDPSPARFRHMAIALKRPPVSSEGTNFYQQSGHKVEIFDPHLDLLGSDVSARIRDRTPVAAHFFGTSSTDTMYLAQLWNVQGENTAVIRLTAITFNSNGSLDSVQYADLAGGPYGAAEAQQPGFSQRCPWDLARQALTYRNPQNVVWRDGRLYFARMCGRTDAFGARWVTCWHVVDLHSWPGSGQQPTMQSSILDGGRIFGAEGEAEFPVHYVFPLVMPTSDGDVALFVTRVYARSYVDLFCTAHRANDQADWLGAPLKLVKAGEAAVTNGTQWGDYLSVALDSNQSNKVWFCGETGRCDAANAECNACQHCGDPPSAAAGQRQNCFHSVVGSYTIPHDPTRELTLLPPPDISPTPHAVKIMPMDLNGAADVNLIGMPVSRHYPHGTSVTLRAPKVPNLLFQGWKVDGVDVGPPSGVDPYTITIVMKSATAAVPVYKPE